MSSDDAKMCDSSNAETTPNIITPDSSTEKQLPMENSSSSSSSQCNESSTYFQNSPCLPVVSSSGAAGMQGVIQQNIQHHNNMIMDPQQQQHHVSIHHPQNVYANQHLQHQIMEGHHHQAHQMNLFQQPNNNAHQFSQMQQPIPPAHILHPNIPSNNSQPFMPFAFNFNSNMSGNVASYNNNQMGNFVHNNYNQLGNHQHPSCFMQQQSLANSKSPSTVGWMSSPTSTVPISNMVTNNYSNMSLVGPTRASATNISRSVRPDPTVMPGGLEHLWKKVPIDCQKIMTPQDVPDSARLRGYFTVCELLQLKQTLVMRMSRSGLPLPIRESTIEKTTSVKMENEECEKGPKKRSKNKNSSQVITEVKSPKSGNKNEQKHQNKKQKRQEIDDKPPEQKGQENEEEKMKQNVDVSKCIEQILVLNADKSQATVVNADMPPITGTHVAVTEAITGLTSDGDNASADPNCDASNETEDKTNTDDKEKADVGTNNSENLESNGSTSQCKPGITGEELAMPSPSPQIPDMPSKTQLPKENLSSETVATSIDTEKKEMTEKEEHKQFPSQIPILAATTTPALTTGTCTVHVNSADIFGNYCGPLEHHTIAPVMPFRTVTLVLKLLQIGNYGIRSFSHLNLNRFRVIFNAHRISYECQLPIIRDATPNANPNLMRKVLTVEFGFEQISLLRFGEDNLFMRVEGAPLLTLSYSPAMEEPNQTLTPIDQLLLEQIDKGQLDLSPCHQLYFLNERLVQQLESQFLEHPRFRQLMLQDEYNQQRYAQKRMRMS